MESDRINSNVEITETEKLVKNSLGNWVASHRNNMDSESLRLLANVVTADFASLLDADVHHHMPTSHICKECLRRGVTNKSFTDSFKDWATGLLNERPKPRPEYDQAPVTVQQALLNTAYLLECMTDETTFAFLGDDDFHSLLLAKLLPKLSITVFETDTRIISSIRDIAKRESLNISVIHTDMRDGIHCNYHGQFNGFYSDPPYSEPGILLFLYCGMTLLVDQCMSWGVMAVPFTLLPLGVRQMILILQKYLIENGFLIEESIPFFKQSPSALGIISGIMKFQRVHLKAITPPPKAGDIYEHFY